MMTFMDHGGESGKVSLGGCSGRSLDQKLMIVTLAGPELLDLTIFSHQEAAPCSQPRDIRANWRDGI